MHLVGHQSAVARCGRSPGRRSPNDSRNRAAATDSNFTNLAVGRSGSRPSSAALMIRAAVALARLVRRPKLVLA